MPRTLLTEDLAIAEWTTFVCNWLIVDLKVPGGISPLTRWGSTRWPTFDERVSLLCLGPWGRWITWWLGWSGWWARARNWADSSSRWSPTGSISISE